MCYYISNSSISGKQAPAKIINIQLPSNIVFGCGGRKALTF
jgi:hypothetical protein